jgi:nitroimidazol reductase NimA-like FMN-containing flavoprotein (pyridoxamine 5'-phosphate oxidase superfamily)
MMADIKVNHRNRVKRAPERGVYERDAIYEIVDEALFCHVGFVQDGQPYVIPSIHARDGDDLLLHGATTSRLIRHIQAGHEVCVAITFMDGLVLARSIYSHSMNYRSAMLFGKGRLIEGDEETLHALELLSEHIMPGRWEDARKPNNKELKATAVVSISIESASAKVRTGPPDDEDEDYELRIWAGVLPIKQCFLNPESDPQSKQDITLPEYISSYHRKS